MSIETVLVQLQSLVCQLDQTMSVQAKNTLINDCKKYKLYYGDTLNHHDKASNNKLNYRIKSALSILSNYR